MPINKKLIDEKIKDNLENIKKEINNKTTFYHGNENKEHRFSEIRPCFFTTDNEYAKAYGDYVYPYTLDIEHPFDTATDEDARLYYNKNFLNDELGKEARFIEKGERISENDADNFFAYLAVEVQINKDLKYDSILVHEAAGKVYNTDISVVPLNVNQIKPKKDVKIKNKYRH